MNGRDVFVSIVYFLAKGKEGLEIESNQVIKNWKKSVIGKKYNSVFAHRAQGYTHPLKTGIITLTKEGCNLIESFLNSLPLPNNNTSMIIFGEKNTHSFDKYIRNILKSANKEIKIVDTYVSGQIFDNLLDESPKNIPIKFLYKQDNGGFLNRIKRFKKEYNFQEKNSHNFHDRFIIIDEKGYIIGPSLKDAADKKPAILITLNNDDSKKLDQLFLMLWNEI